MEAAVALQADQTLAQGPWGGTAQSVALGLPPVDTPEENPAPTRPAPHTRAIHTTDTATVIFFALFDQ